ncbi:GOLPH3/VPS74 family protein [Salininema proteolyticum]|uniref:GPP34 family phosphoprotein n=1 Tax=Salininema proteolyticum TaxID=1607685 RepID=A0ABV8TUN8_9ACTN
MDLTLAEETLLLLLDDADGRPVVDADRFYAALAGAVAADLVLQGALKMTDVTDVDHRPGRLVRTGADPGSPEMADVVDLMHGCSPRQAVGKIGGQGDWRRRRLILREIIADGLVDRRGLRASRSRFMGVIPLRSWLPGAHDLETPVALRVERALFEGGEPDEKTAVLISILHAAGALPRLYPNESTAAMERRAQKIRGGDECGPAIERTVRDGRRRTALMTITSATLALFSVGLQLFTYWL